MTNETPRPAKAPNLPSHKLLSVFTKKDGTKDYTEIGAAWPTRSGGFSFKMKAFPAPGGDFIMVVNKPREATA